VINVKAGKLAGFVYAGLHPKSISQSLKYRLIDIFLICIPSTFAYYYRSEAGLVYAVLISAILLFGGQWYLFVKVYGRQSSFLTNEVQTKSITSRKMAQPYSPKEAWEGTLDFVLMISVFIVIVLYISGFLAPNIASKYPTSNSNNINSSTNDIDFHLRNAITVTDVHLRSGPSQQTSRAGVVPKGSRIQLTRYVNGFFYVRVIEYGRLREDPFQSNEGWINSAYIEVQ
jgi:hypothetical protein